MYQTIVLILQPLNKNFRFQKLIDLRIKAKYCIFLIIKDAKIYMKFQAQKVVELLRLVMEAKIWG